VENQGGIFIDLDSQPARAIITVLLFLLAPLFPLVVAYPCLFFVPVFRIYFLVSVSSPKGESTMGLLSRFMKPKFQDEQLVARAQSAIDEDPLIPAGSDIHFTSEKGVLIIKGTALNDREKNHVEGTVRSSLRQSGLKFDHIENQVTIRR